MTAFIPTLLGFINLPQGGELILIFFVVLLLFGAKKLPELARGMGKAINEFKRASTDIQEDIKKSIEDEPKASSESSEASSESSEKTEEEPEATTSTEEEKKEKEPAHKS